MTNQWRYLNLCLLAFVFSLNTTHASEKIGTAFSSALFDGVHIIDVKASTQAWVDCLGERHSIGDAAPVQILKNAKELSAAVDAESFELAVLSTTDFLQIEHPEKLEPKFVGGIGASVCQPLLLLIRKDSGITSLSELKEKEIMLPENRYSSVISYWIDTQLMDQKLADSKEHFFSNIRTHKKSTCVILPVFFGKCDACIISKRTFTTMCELNPQIGRILMPLEISPPYLASLICMRTEGDPELKRKLSIAVSTLHKSADGMQMMMSCHVDRYEDYKDGQLTTTTALLNHYNSLKATYETP